MPSRADVFARAQWNLKILADTRRDGVDFYPRGKDERWWIKNHRGFSLCRTPSDHDPREIWVWKNVELVDGNHVPSAVFSGIDTETPTERVSRLLLNPNSNPPMPSLHIRIQQRHRELDLATMKLKTTRLDHDDRARIELAQRIADELESPFCDKAIDLEIDQHWVGGWDEILLVWADTLRTRIEDVTLHPDSVSQMDKFRAGWVLSTLVTDKGLFADFDAFMKTSVDMSVMNKTERPWSYRRPDNGGVPLKTTAESAFSWIQDATTAWRNNQMLVHGPLAPGVGWAIKNGNVVTLGSDRIRWTWAAADYDPATALIAEATMVTTDGMRLKPFTHYNVKLNLAQMRVVTPFTEDETNTIRQSNRLADGKITPFSNESMMYDLKTKSVPARWEAALARMVTRARAYAGFKLYIEGTYTHDDRVYIGWAVDNPGLDFAAFEAAMSAIPHTDSRFRRWDKLGKGGLDMTTLDVYLPKVMADMESWKLDPATINQNMRFIVGWWTSNPPGRVPGDIPELLAERHRTGRTAEEAFPRIRNISVAWRNRTTLLDPRGVFDSALGVTRRGGLVFTLGRDNGVAWQWDTGEYNPDSSVIRFLRLAWPGIGIVRENVKLDLVTMRVETGLTASELEQLLPPGKYEDVAVAWRNRATLLDPRGVFDSALGVTRRDGLVFTLGRDPGVAWQWDPRNYHSNTSVIGYLHLDWSGGDIFRENVKLDLVTMRVETGLTASELEQLLPPGKYEDVAVAWRNQTTLLDPSGVFDRALGVTKSGGLVSALGRDPGVAWHWDPSEYDPDTSVIKVLRLAWPGLDIVHENVKLDLVTMRVEAVLTTSERKALLPPGEYKYVAVAWRNWTTILNPRAVFDSALGATKRDGLVFTLGRDDGILWNWDPSDYDRNTSVIKSLILDWPKFTIARKNVKLDLVTMRVETELTAYEREQVALPAGVRTKRRGSDGPDSDNKQSRTGARLVYV